ncbi:Txe/YoeB family addiction module toxin [Algoriphagus sp. NF]|jgi:toxin YoeB|uniref:Putative mRNA interferase YoeB n=1 Tax=Algoriphagus marincola TaxID=264027 RepID=A0ABS7N4Y8_9BACT|nr:MULTISPECIES: Txe/YoeB family addiction module toxin [Algoriphagus]MBY5951405.1 Txe/YoeB family addiction module toxin [Algoriphagus marincola]MDE0559576.1 Txe/YoeB family addiction module toxin [Algoriphagus sp. NF]
MKYELAFTDQAIKDIEKFKISGDKPLLRKLRALLDELQVHPQTGTGKPERLKHDFAGYWSRRINHKHRLIYSIEEDKVLVTIIAAFGHYS